MLKNIIFLLLIVYIQNGICGILIVDEYYSTKFGSKKKQKEIIIFQKNKIKIETNAYSRKMVSIIDLDNNTIVFFSPLRRIYSKMRFNEYFKYFDNMKKQFKEQMKKLSPKEKEFMEKLITGENKNLNLKIKKDNFKPVIAGFLTEHYKVFNRKEIVAEFFISKKLKNFLEQEIDYKKYINLFSKIDKKTKSVFSIYGKNRENLRLSEIKFNLEKEGYIVKEMVKVFIPFFGKTTDITEVKEVHFLKVSNSEFEIPDNFKKVPFKIFQEKISDLEK